MRKFNTVKQGSTGTDVYILQSLLRAMGILGGDNKPLDIDGSCGSKTAGAIRKFQAICIAYGTPVETNGTCGSKMWKVLLGV